MKIRKQKKYNKMEFCTSWFVRGCERVMYVAVGLYVMNMLCERRKKG